MRRLQTRRHSDVHWAIKRRPHPSPLTSSTFQAEIRPVLALAFLLSTLPLSSDPKTGRPRASLFSWATLYTLLTYSVWSVYTTLEINTRITQIDWRLDGRLSFYRGVLYLAIIPSIPLTRWTVVGRMVRYLNQWSEFEALYWQVTGSMLSLRVRRKALILSVALPLITAAVTYYNTLSIRKFTFWFVPLFWYAIIQRFLLDALWHLKFSAIRSAGQGFLYYMRSAIFKPDRPEHQRASKDKIKASIQLLVIRKYRCLWLELSDLARTAGSVIFPAYVVHWLLLCCTLTLSSYGALVHLTDNGSSEQSFKFLIECVIVLVQCQVLINEPYTTSKLLSGEVQEELQTLLKNEKITNETKEEISMFLQVVSMNPPVVSLGGYFNVDRTLLTSLLSTLMTYLIVLLQFRLNIPQDGNTTTNTTTLKFNTTDNIMDQNYTQINTTENV